MRPASSFACALGLLALTTSCVGDDGPVDPFAPGSLGLALQPALIPSAGDGAAAPINRIRAITSGYPAGAVVAVTTIDVSPSAESWELVVSLPGALTDALVTVQLYLINVAADGTETVEFSGSVGPVEIVQGEAVSPDVPLVRGPLANLYTTAVTITDPPGAMLEGTTESLSAEATTTAMTEPTIYWTSLDPTVLGMEGSTASALVPGSARVVASAGAHADTVTILVASSDATPPTLVSTSPASGATGVSPYTTVTATFDEPLDPSSVNGTTFTLLDAQGAPIAGTVSYSGLVATLATSAPLFQSTGYTASVTTGIRDLVGNALPKGTTWSFTTGTFDLSASDSLLPGLGSLVSIAIDAVSTNLFVYPEFGVDIRELTTAGVEVTPAIPRPGFSSNDIDLEFVPASLNVGGTIVPANTLLVMNGEQAPRDLFAVTKDAGTVLAFQTLTVGTSVGAAHHPRRGTIFNVDWNADLVSEIDPSTGAVLASFTLRPTSAPNWDLHYGDIEIDLETGNLMIVSSYETSIRVMTPTGTWLRDVTVGGAGEMTGIAWDDSAGVAWISSRYGTIYRVPGLRPFLPG